MKRFTTLLLGLSVAGLPTAEAFAHPHVGGVVRGGAHVAIRSARPFVAGRAVVVHRGSSCHYGCGPYWYGGGFGLGGVLVGSAVTPAYYGDYYTSPAPAVVEHGASMAPANIVQWDDEELKDLALNKFAFTRGLDRDGNRIILEVTSKSYSSDTGAMTKVKFKVRWVEWTIKKAKDGSLYREEKQKSTTIKLKFDDFGRFTEYCD